MVHRSTVLGLVTYAQVVAFSSESSTEIRNNGSRELNLFYGDSRVMTEFATWNGKMILSGAVKSPMFAEGVGALLFGDAGGDNIAMLLANKSYTRSGLFVPNGRDLVNSMEKGNRILNLGGFEGTIPIAGRPTGSFVILDRYAKTNPYILQPTDKLIFGWQLPVADRLNSSFGSPQYDGKGTELSFGTTPAKITFYGSMLRAGEEYHETTNQLLSSHVVHEVIG